MPYIKQENRDRILVDVDSEFYSEKLIDYGDIHSAGELQYAMAVMFKSYIKRKGLNYQNCNDIMGALAGAQMEFYRRVVSVYEDGAIERNGDVYDKN